MSEIRYDILKDEYVLIAPERARRPIKLNDSNVKENNTECPFCPQNEHLIESEIFSIKKDNKWRTKVIPNIYRVAGIENKFYKKIDGIFESFGTYGAHEVIIDTPKHNVNIWDLKTDEIVDWLKTIQIRYEDLKKDKNLIYLNVFKNSGIKAGASQSHPHTQLIALPIIPRKKINLYKRSLENYKQEGISLFEKVFSNEKFLVEKTAKFFAVTPFSSAFAFEIIIIPNDFNYEMQNITDLAKIIKNVSKKLKAHLGIFDFNLYFDFPPLNKNFQNKDFFDEIDKIACFNIRIIPRIYNIAGFEISSGMFINVIPPEKVYEVFGI